MELYKTYLVVGGMPGAVREYLKEGSMIDARDTQSLILNTYIADMAKYMACFNSISAQRVKDNKKFQYKVV